MIFGETVLVPYKDGLSTKKNASNNRDYPDYEYCISSVYMRSKLLSAITNYSLTSEKFTTDNIEKVVDYKYYKSLFDFEESKSRIIKAEIDLSSLSDDLYCLSDFNNEIRAVKPKSIHLILKEMDSHTPSDSYSGTCYFDDEREEREFDIRKGTNSLEISIAINSETFSSLFDNIKGGDKFLYTSIYFSVYADTVDRMAAIIAPSTYIIDASYKNKCSFVMLKDITLSSSDSIKKEHDEQEASLQNKTLDEEDPQIKPIEKVLDEVLSQISYLDKNSYESSQSLLSINSNIKTVSFLLILLIALFFFKFVW